MKTKFANTSASRHSSLQFGSARLHARIARRLTQGTSSPSTSHFNSSLSLFNSLWSPLRLDLLKVPVTRHRD